MSQYAVIDLEMCKVPKRYRTKEFHFTHEVIQIGAALVSESYEVVDKFNTFVHPEFGLIDTFIKDLTGISAKDVKAAPAFREALDLFLEWLPEDVKIVAWSESDQNQICHEMEGKQIKTTRDDLLTLEPWIDCQKIFTEKLDEAYASRAYNLTEALNLAGIDYMDGAHDGYVDAYNTALLFCKLQQVQKLEVNPAFGNLGIEQESLSFSMGDLFRGIQL